MKVFLVVLFLVCGCSTTASYESNYLIGSGSGDITGPVVDVGFSGYVRPTDGSSS